MIIGLAVGVLVGVSLGFGGCHLIHKRRLEQFFRPERERVEAEFRAHVEAVAGQVSEFADHLAAEDPVLRAKLRRFEMRSRS